MSLTVTTHASNTSSSGKMPSFLHIRSINGATFRMVAFIYEEERVISFTKCPVFWKSLAYHSIEAICIAQKFALCVISCSRPLLNVAWAASFYILILQKPTQQFKWWKVSGFMQYYRRAPLQLVCLYKTGKTAEEFWIPSTRYLHPHIGCYVLRNISAPSFQFSPFLRTASYAYKFLSYKACVKLQLPAEC